MNKINFEDATLVTQAKVTVGGTDYEVTPATYSGGTDLDATTLNDLQDNVEASFKNTKTTSTTDGYCCTYANDNFELKGTVLYNDVSGTNTSVPLSDNASNYNYLEIYYRSNDGNNNVSSIKVYSPNGKILFLRYEIIVSSQVYVKISKATISSNSISISDGIQYYFTIANNQQINGQTNQPNIYVTRVVGYK